MNTKGIANTYTLGQIGLLIVVVLVLWGIGNLAEGMIDNYRIRRMKQGADSGLLQTQTRLIETRLKADSLEAVLAGLEARVRPDLQDIKRLASDHGLRIRQMERLTTETKASSDMLRYTAVVEGRISGLVRLLKALETDFIFESEQLQLAPANDDGSRVLMQLLLTVRSS